MQNHRSSSRQWSGWCNSAGRHTPPPGLTGSRTPWAKIIGLAVILARVTQRLAQGSAAIGACAIEPLEEISATRAFETLDALDYSAGLVDCAIDLSNTTQGLFNFRRDPAKVNRPYRQQ